MSILHCGYKEKKMNSYIGMFEIPATNITRAINFYESILGIKIEKMELKSMEKAKNTDRIQSFKWDCSWMVMAFRLPSPLFQVTQMSKPL